MSKSATEIYAALTELSPPAGAMRIYHYQVEGEPGDWRTLVAPGCSLEQAALLLAAQLGGRKVSRLISGRVGWSEPSA